MFTCPGGLQINLTIMSSCPSSGSSSSGSSSKGSSGSGGSSSSSSTQLSKSDIKQAILSCIANNVTMGMQAVSLNKSQATNQTFLYKIGNSTADCIPSLMKSNHTTKTTSKQPTTLSTGTVTVTKPLKVGEHCGANSNNCPYPSLKGHTLAFRIGYKFGVANSKTGIYDPPGSCGQPQGIDNQTAQYACGHGYSQAFYAFCKQGKFGCTE